MKTLKKALKSTHLIDITFLAGLLCCGSSVATYIPPLETIAASNPEWFQSVAPDQLKNVRHPLH